jgi:hypothetical protein
MANGPGGAEIGAMIRAQISFKRRRRGAVLQVLDLNIGTLYGLTAHEAHQVLLFALTAAKKPVVADAAGAFYRIPQSWLHSLIVWSSEDP